MRLLSYAVDGGQRVGAVVDDTVVDLTSISRSYRLGGQPMVRLLAGGTAALEQARAHIAGLRRPWTPGAHLALEHAQLLAPVVRPGKVVAIGRNYADHAAETGVKLSLIHI